MSVYSHRFYAQAGLRGASSPIFVPAGEVWVVKQITMYSTPLVGQLTAFFEDDTTGAALFSARFTIDAGGWQGFYGAIVFEVGDGFHFQVDPQGPGDAADVYVGGYKLTSP